MSLVDRRFLGEDGFNPRRLNQVCEECVRLSEGLGDTLPEA
jgi:hypothetical protein